MSSEIDENQNSKSSGAIQNDKLSDEDYMYFMSISYIAAIRSKNSARQAGACIVNEDNRIVGIGSNCFMKVGENSHGYYAIMDAILNTNSYDCKNCALFVLSFPCNESAKLIIQSGIRSVFYLSDTYENEDKIKHEASKKLLKMAGVDSFLRVPKELQIFIDLNSYGGSHRKRLKCANNQNIKDCYDFMSIAYLASRRSKDPETQVGACIVNEDNRIVGIGYNCFPNKCSDDKLSWAKKK